MVFVISWWIVQGKLCVYKAGDDSGGITISSNRSSIAHDKFDKKLDFFCVFIASTTFKKFLLHINNRLFRWKMFEKSFSFNDSFTYIIISILHARKMNMKIEIIRFLFCRHRQDKSNKIFSARLIDWSLEKANQPIGEKVFVMVVCCVTVFRQ